MKPYSWDSGLNYDLAEVADEQVNRIEQEQVLHFRAVTVNGVEDSRHVHQKLGKDRPEILDIPEKHEQRRQHQSNPDIKQHQTGNGVEQQDEFPGKRDAVYDAEHKKHAERQGKVNQCLYILRK